MNTKSFTILFCLLFTLPALVMSDDTEYVIPLYEIVTSGTIEGDNPFDNSGENDETIPNPNQFRATITGRSLSVAAENALLNRALVRDVVSGTIVLDTQFTGSTSHQLSSSGNYILEIRSANLILIGQFIAQ